MGLAQTSVDQVVIAGATVVGLGLVLLGYGTLERRNAAAWMRDNRPDAEKTAKRLKERYLLLLSLEIVEILRVTKLPVHSQTTLPMPKEVAEATGRQAIEDAIRSTDRDANVAKLSKALSDSQEVLRLHKKVAEVQRQYGEGIMKMGASLSLGSAFATVVLMAAPEPSATIVAYVLGFLTVLALYSFGINVGSAWSSSKKAEDDFEALTRDVWEESVRV